MTGTLRDVLALTLVLAGIACAATAVGLWVGAPWGFATAALPVGALGVAVGMAQEPDPGTPPANRPAPPADRPSPGR